MTMLPNTRLRCQRSRRHPDRSAASQTPERRSCGDNLAAVRSARRRPAWLGRSGTAKLRRSPSHRRCPEWL